MAAAANFDSQVKRIWHVLPRW